MLTAIQTGSFVTRARVRVYSALLLLAYTATIVALLATADGIVDRAGRPIGTDFANVYAAGRLALEGKAPEAYDWPAHHATQKRISGREDIPHYGWHYPPMFLLVAAALAALPYLGALLVYQAATLAAYLAVVRAIVGRPQTWLLALAFPGVFVNVTHGHNGFITAALLGAGLVLLDRRPMLAGLALGALAYKPQLGLLVPLVLAVSGRWQVIGWAAGTAAALAGITLALFGTDTFAAFWHSLPLTGLIVREGAPGFYKIQSLYAGLRLAGAPADLANAAQLALTLAAAAGLVALWRSTAAFELKAAGLILGCVIATPYVLDYDLVVLAPAIAFLAANGLRQGFAPYEVTVMTALWVLPLFARTIAEATAISLAPLVLIAAFLFILERAGVLPDWAQLRRAHQPKG
ncbi:MAG TPA: glycosyltransferase family 87 protein [Hyphomicrobiaceae bacterium]|nr:glycosyltransferase family 87 protein [Hyphomicrobiaceae bacterium]